MARMQWFTQAVFLLMVISMNSQAKLYKWVDKQGQTHFSDQPPLNSEVKIETLSAPEVGNQILAPEKIEFYQAPKKTARKRKTKRRNCNKYAVRIDKVQQQLRRGYKEPRGNKLRARRRELSEQLRQCQKGY